MPSRSICVVPNVDLTEREGEREREREGERERTRTTPLNFSLSSLG